MRWPSTTRLWTPLLVSASACLAADNLPKDGPVLWQPRPKATLTVAPSPPPAGPFRFLSEDTNGRSPKVNVSDSNGRSWSVKFGPEVKAETFATRIVWAMGYYSDASWYVPRGRITGAPTSGRLTEHVDDRGEFTDARFEYRDSTCRWIPEKAWSWKENPFAGSDQLNGLKVLVMLLSNWDHKDEDDGDSNTGVLQCRGRQLYYITDWGGSMGKWGRKFFHNKWDCEGFAEQTPEFIKGVDGNEVKFGFTSGRGGDEFKSGMTLANVRWITRLLARLTDKEIRAGLVASGADEHEATHFMQSLLARMQALTSSVSGAAKLGQTEDHAARRVRTARALRPFPPPSFRRSTASQSIAQGFRPQRQGL